MIGSMLGAKLTQDMNVRAKWRVPLDAQSRTGHKTWMSELSGSSTWMNKSCVWCSEQNQSILGANRTRHMNTWNEALDPRNEMEMRYDKYLMLGAKWSGWYVTPTAPLEPTMDGKKKKSICLSCLSFVQNLETWLRQVVLWVHPPASPELVPIQRGSIHLLQALLIYGTLLECVSSCGGTPGC